MLWLSDWVSENHFHREACSYFNLLRWRTLRSQYEKKYICNVLSIFIYIYIYIIFIIVQFLVHPVAVPAAGRRRVQAGVEHRV